MTAEKVRKEVTVRASRNRTDQHEETRDFPFDLGALDHLASKLAVALNAVLSVNEAILAVSSDLAYVPRGTKADPDPQYRKKLLETFHILQSLLFICRDIASDVVPPLEREVRRLAPNAFKEEYISTREIDLPRKLALEGLERLRSKK